MELVSPSAIGVGNGAIQRYAGNGTTAFSLTQESDHTKLALGKTSEFDGTTDVKINIPAQTTTDTNGADLHINAGARNGSGTDGIVYIGNTNTTKVLISNAELSGDIAVGSLITGSGSANGEVKSNGNNDLILKTGNTTTGSITIANGADGAITLAPHGSGTVTVSAGTNDFDIASHDGTNGLKLAGTLVTSSAAELNKLTGVTATSGELNYLDITTLGTSADSKALTQSANGVVTIGATDGNQVLNIASHDLVDGGLKLAGTLVTASAAELNLLDGSSAGTVEHSKAVIYSAAGDVKGTTLTSTGNVTVGDNLSLSSDTAVLSIGSTGAVTLTHSDSILTLNASKKLAFGDAGDYITGDGTNLSVISSGAATITAAAESTWSTSTGLLTLNGAGGLTLGTAGNTAITIDPHGTGNLTLGSSDNATTSLNGAALNIDATGHLQINSSGGIYTASIYLSVQKEIILNFFYSSLLSSLSSKKKRRMK